MTTPASPPPGIYHSRSRVTRNRLAFIAAGLALVLLGYLIGRLQGGSDTPAAAAPPASSPVPVESPAPTESPADPPPSSAALPAPGGIDAYAVLQAEAADGQQGTESQETEDEGGGQNVGWIGNGDWLRFDDVEFGDQPATKFTARIASDTDDRGGRIEVRIDSPGNEPAGSLTIEDTDGWQNWQSRTAAITPTTGRHTVFITFAREGDGEFVNLNYFSFAR